MRKPNRITNFCYALDRLLAFLAAVVALCFLAAYAWAVDRTPWQLRALLVAMPLLVALVTGHAALTAAWWVEFRKGALRVRYLLGVHEYPWPEVLAVRPIRLNLAGILTHLFRRRYVEFTTARRRTIVVYIAQRDMPTLVAGAGPRWAGGDIERKMKRQRFWVLSPILLAAVLLLLAVIVLSLLLYAQSVLHF